MAFRYFLLPTTQNVGSYWKKSNVRFALHIRRVCSTHLRERPWKETQYFPCSAKTIAKNSFIRAEAIFQVKKKKRYNLNKLLWDILTRYLFLSACIQECKIYLIFQNTYFYLIINLLNFETCYYCLKGITVISVYTQYVGFVEMFYISCYTDNTVGNLYTRWIISTNFLLVSSLPINVNIKTGSPSLQANCRLATDC